MIYINAKFNFVIPDELLQRVRAIAEQRNTSVAQIIIAALNGIDDSEWRESVERRLREFEERLKALEESSK